MNPPGIAIAGCGNVGNDIVSLLHRNGVTGAVTLAVNTDSGHLKLSHADKRILIGKSLKGGLGAGGCPTLGRRAGEQGIPVIDAVIEFADLVILTAGLGGGTGSGALPLIAKAARENGSLVICFVTLPPDTERYPRVTAIRSLKDLLPYADSVIVLDYRQIALQYPDRSSAQVFRKMVRMTADTIRAITDLLTVPSRINLDFGDLRDVMKNKGIGLILAGESEEGVINKNESVTLSSLSHPAVNLAIAGASAGLVCITGSSDTNLFDAEEIATSVSYTLNPHAGVLWGLRVNDDREEKVRVYAVVTGLLRGEDVLISETHPDFVLPACISPDE